MIEKVKGCFLGLAVGDALGVPVEFRDRSYLKIHPVKGMLGYGTWNQPPGTWSDDSSMSFCLAESPLINTPLRILLRNSFDGTKKVTGERASSYLTLVEQHAFPWHASRKAKIRYFPASLARKAMATVP